MKIETCVLPTFGIDAEITKCQIESPLIQTYPRSPDVSDSQSELSRSLEEFCNSLAEIGIDRFMERFKKKSGQHLSFTLKPYSIGYDPSDRQESIYFYKDGKHSLFLGVKGEGDDPIWVGICGIRMTHDFKEYYNKLGSNSHFKSTSYKLPCVVQIQGKKSLHSKEDKLLDLAVSSYKWERALAFFATEWARIEGFPAFYMLPAEKNAWNNKIRESNFLLRYDVTARRLGFRMQENGLYGLSLFSTQPSDLALELCQWNARNGDSQELRHP